MITNVTGFIIGLMFLSFGTGMMPGFPSPEWTFLDRFAFWLCCVFISAGSICLSQSLSEKRP